MENTHLQRFQMDSTGLHFCFGDILFLKNTSHFYVWMFVCQKITSCVGLHFKKWWRLDSICEAIVLLTRFFLLRTDLFPASMIIFCFYFKKGTLDRRYTINMHISCIRDITFETKDRCGHTTPLPVHGCRLPEHSQQNLYTSQTNHAISVIQDVAMNECCLIEGALPRHGKTHGSDPPKPLRPCQCCLGLCTAGGERITNL